MKKRLYIRRNKFYHISRPRKDEGYVIAFVTSRRENRLYVNKYLSVRGDKYVYQVEINGGFHYTMGDFCEVRLATQEEEDEFLVEALKA